jgi:hypothetical protein
MLNISRRLTSDLLFCMSAFAVIALVLLFARPSQMIDPSKSPSSRVSLLYAGDSAR